MVFKKLFYLSLLMTITFGLRATGSSQYTSQALIISSEVTKTVNSVLMILENENMESFTAPIVVGSGNYKGHGQVPGTTTVKIECGVYFWKTCWRLYSSGLLTAGDGEITIAHGINNWEPVVTEVIEGNEVHTLVYFYE